jgi:mannose-1-phosphate guanylyltransferase
MASERDGKVTQSDGNIRAFSSPRASLDDRWGVVLAGGDGTRLLDLTRLISGDARPKQFCSLFAEHSLLAQTCHRAQRSIPADRILIPVSSAHRNFYMREPGIRPSQRIVQPANKGTAPAIVHSLLSIERHSRDAMVAVLPSDHHYSDEQAFTATLETAFDTAARHRDSVVVLGSPARSAHVEYGWIEPGPPLADAFGSFEVRGFREKPSADRAIELFEQGALWNTFVMVGRVGAFLDMISAARTGLLRAFPPDWLWSGTEVHLPPWLYDRFYAIDFSRDILSLQAQHLIALKMENIEWNDLGRPERVMDVLHASGLKPWWMKEWHALRKPPGVAAPLSGAAVA